MKKLIMICMSLLMLTSLVACGQSTNEKDDKVKIGIVQLVDHASLNTIRDSIVKELAKQGYEDGKDASIMIKNAGNDMSNLDTICKQFDADKVDVIIAITTPAAQAAAPYAERIPVIFSAVSDVKAAGLVNDVKAPDLNITGTSDEIQVGMILDLAMDMYPSTNTIGYLYNSGEANSVANLKKVKAYAKKQNLTVEVAAVSSAGDIQTGLQSLLEKSDVIFSATDNTVANAMPQVSSLCNEAKKPFFAGADSMVKDGALATYGIDYEDLGVESAKMAVKVLNGSAIKDIPVKVFKKDLNLYINKTTAEKIEFTKIDALREKFNVVEFN